MVEMWVNNISLDNHIKIRCVYSLLCKYYVSSMHSEYHSFTSNSCHCIR